MDFGGVASGLVGGLLALGGVLIADWRTRRREARARWYQERYRLYCEMLTLLTRLEDYVDVLGALIGAFEEEDDPQAEEIYERLYYSIDVARDLRSRAELIASPEMVEKGEDLHRLADEAVTVVVSYSDKTGELGNCRPADWHGSAAGFREQFISLGRRELGTDLATIA